MERIEEILREFGLTEYEIKAFITLLKLKMATAEQISEIGSIPLPRVYDTLVELNKKGFVLISKTRPKKFKLLPIQKALNNLVKVKKEYFDSSINSLSEKIKDVSTTISDIETIQETAEDSFTLWSTEKRRNVTSVLDEQKKIAQREILIFSGDLSWLADTEKLIRDIAKKGIKIRVVVHRYENETWMKNIKLAKKLGIEVRVGYEGITRGHVIDDKIVSLAMKKTSKGVNIAGDGLPGNDGLSQYELFTSNNHVLITILKENFEFWWKKLNG